MPSSAAPTRNRKSEQAEETRSLLIAAARERFGEAGYTATSIDEIAARVGVTIGALYHHFRDKRALFQAVHEQVERELSRDVVTGMRERIAPDATAWDEVLAASHAFLDACMDPAVQRILMLEAPSLLSDAPHEFARHGLEMIRLGLQRAMDQRLIEQQPVEPMAHLLRAALSEAALLLARSPDPAAARAEIGAAIDRLINGLLVRQIEK
jgi:AcrR family transcriptional regulator